MNDCKFMGNLTRDPETRETGSGKSVCNFGLAVNRSFKRGDERVSEVAFLDMEVWDTGATTIAKYFAKGEPIIVDCSVKQDNWEDKETGQKRSKLKFRVNQFYFIPGFKYKSQAENAPEAGKSKRGRPKKEEAAEPVAVGSGSDNSEIPF